MSNEFPGRGLTLLLFYIMNTFDSFSQQSTVYELSILYMFESVSLTTLKQKLQHVLRHIGLL